jgi:PAS domain S-box-containing protein
MTASRPAERVLEEAEGAHDDSSLIRVEGTWILGARIDGWSFARSLRDEGRTLKKQSTFESSIEVADKVTEVPSPSAPAAACMDPEHELVSLLHLAQEISLDASKALTTESVLLLVLERIGTYTHWPCGHVWLQTSENDVLESTDLWHVAENARIEPFRAATHLESVGFGEGLVGAAVREGRAVWWTALQEHPDFLRREAAAVVGIRTGFAFPAFYSGRLVAVFEFFTREDSVPSEAFLEIMAQIGILVGNVFERRRTEANLAWNETLLRRMTDASRLGFFVAGTDRRSTLYLNERFREIWGLPREAVSQPWSVDRIASFCESQLLESGTGTLFAPDGGLRSETEVTLQDGRTIRTVSARIGGDEFVPLGRMYAHEDVSRRKHAEQRFRDLLESAPDGMIILEDDGRIVRVNAEAERMFGYGRERLVGERIDILLPVEAQTKYGGLPEDLLRDLQEPVARSELNLLARRSNGESFPVEINLSPLTTEVGAMTIAAIRDITRRKELERQLSVAVWQEQQALGRELHDGLGGSLTGLTMISKSLREKLDRIDPILAEKAREITECAQSALLATRDLANVLVPVQIEERGFLAALEELAANTTKQSGIRCSFERHVSMEIEDAVLATHLFRIAQEAVTNAVRHGHGTWIRITVRAHMYRLLLEIEDDGCGLALDGQGAGLGMHTMRHRAGLVGGILRIRNRPKQRGTSVTCLVKGWLGDDDNDTRGGHERRRHAGAGGR